MAEVGIVPVCLLFVFATNVVCDSHARSGAPRFTCDQVRDLFEAKIGSPVSLRSHPHHENETSICRRGHTSHLSCCTVETEETFSEIAEKRLKENVRTRNRALKKHVLNILARYQDRIAFIVSDSRNRTSHVLTHLYKVPAADHEAAVGDFFTALGRGLQGEDVDSLEETVRQFFRNLFPAIFNFVLSSQGQAESEPRSPEYRACLARYAEQIGAFRSIPDALLRQLRRAVQHSLVLQDALSTFANSITSTEAVPMDTDCRRALVRLQVCPGCRGVSRLGAEVKPCRGLCLNVMRGCLYKIAEISSSWDDLVVAFENLQVGMFGHHELQQLVMYIDMNVTDAIMMAMEDSPRIYDEVMVKCHSVSGQPHQAPGESDRKLAPPPEDSLREPGRPTGLLRDFRSEVKSLIKYLEDSKGMFNRLADGLCQEVDLYDQDMQSATCWNGHAVGRYMEEVPEANFLSQARLNTEVKVSVTPDFSLLQVKDTLAHMRRNLSTLLNSDLMMGDSPNRQPYYKNVEGSGLYRHDVLVKAGDDEDLVGSGSGSGSGDDQPDDSKDDTTGSGGIVTSRPRPTQRPPEGGAGVSTLSLTLLTACVVSQRLLSIAFK